MQMLIWNFCVKYTYTYKNLEIMFQARKVVSIDHTIWILDLENNEIYSLNNIIIHNTAGEDMPVFIPSEHQLISFFCGWKWVVAFKLWLISEDSITHSKRITKIKNGKQTGEFFFRFIEVSCVSSCVTRIGISFPYKSSTQQLPIPWFLWSALRLRKYDWRN